ncbi:MAG: hypothetical protein ACKV2T_27155 [Kofleriaceae bacterium]
MIAVIEVRAQDLDTHGSSYAQSRSIDERCGRMQLRQPGSLAGMRTPIVFVIGLIACQSTPAPARPTGDGSNDTAPTMAAELAEKVRTVQLHMHLRFAAARRIEQAIVFGNLDRARGEAKIIAELAEPDILPMWQPYIDDVRAAGQQVVLSTSLIAAAKTSAILGHQCAKCHTHTEAKITLPTDSAPTDGVRLANDMASHQWATTRMWEGLLIPSTERWNQGATTLAQAPLAIVAEADLPADQGVSDDIARIRLLARRALEATSMSDRSNVYGELLATCAGCHATIRDR